jgi:uncharacterized UBP type Zn finger protein
MAQECTHLDRIMVTSTDKDYCEECVKIGSPCDSSPNKHASKHFRNNGHPLVRSIEPGETWVWCYADEVMAGELVT